MSADELLAAADRALLLAKRTGKGRVAVANPDAEEELARLQRADASPAAVQALAAAIDARDDYQHGHAEQVVRLATSVAMLLGHQREAVERIGHAALLHDVGKLAIPYEILRKARLARRRRVAHDVPASGDRRGHPAPHPQLAPSRRSCATSTSTGTAAATPTAWRAPRSRSARGSSWPATPTWR